MSGRPSTDIRSVFGPDTLLFGIGNCSRGDDGLGWAFLDRVLQQADFQGQAEYRYQLGVEDAALVARAGRVIFIDSCNGPIDGGFAWQQCEASAEFEFTSHVLPPGAVMPEELGEFLKSTGWKNVVLPETKRKFGVEFYGLGGK